MRPALRPLPLVLALLATTLLSGCESTHYVFRPPASDQGRMCVTQCAGTREACRGNEIRRAQGEKATCERSADASYHTCMAQPVAREKEHDKARDCEKKRKSCWSYENTDRCDDDYRNCFVNCGGSVEEHTR